MASLFINATSALRIERAESNLTRAVTEAAVFGGRAPAGFVHALGAGVASYLRPGSPMNKLIGLGLGEVPEAATLETIEQALGARNEPARVELSTLASLDSFAALSARGYRLLGFENVLVLPLAAEGAASASSIRVEPVTRGTRSLWQETTTLAVATPDETGVVVDSLSRKLLDEAIEDLLAADGFDRYLAFTDDCLAGAASLYVRDGIALLSGSATLPAQRRRGVQAALIAARLDNARKRGAELAVITTAPGSQSQANVMKHGFTLGYARAILVRERVASA